MNGSLSSSAEACLWPFIWIRCVGAGKHLKHAGQGCPEDEGWEPLPLLIGSHPYPGGKKQTLYIFIYSQLKVFCTFPVLCWILLVYCHGYYVFYFLNKATLCTVQLSSTLCIPNLFYCNVIFLAVATQFILGYPSNWPEALPLLFVLSHCHLVGTLANLNVYFFRNVNMI